MQLANTKAITINAFHVFWKSSAARASLGALLKALLLAQMRGTAENRLWFMRVVPELVG